MSEKKKPKFNEEFFLDIITSWKFNWMDVKGTDESDRENYYHRAFGVDANMKYSLARMLEKRVREVVDPDESAEVWKTRAIDAARMAEERNGMVFNKDAELASLRAELHTQKEVICTQSEALKVAMEGLEEYASTCGYYSYPEDTKDAITRIQSIMSKESEKSNTSGERVTGVESHHTGCDRKTCDGECWEYEKNK